VHQVLPHCKLPVPNNEEYNFNTNIWWRVLSRRWAIRDV
jgi:hypothetical protein